MSQTISHSTDPEPETRSSKTKSQQLREARRLGIQPSRQLRSHFLALARRVRTWESHRVDLLASRPISVGVVGLSPSVGCSTVAFNLTDVLASLAEDQVLLIETEVKRNSISRRVAPRSKGLVQWLDENSAPEQCLKQLPIDRVSVMGPGAGDAAELLELSFDGVSARIQEELDSFAYVVWDLPTADDLTACFSICPELDGVILVVPADDIEPQAVQRFQQRLADCGTDLIGLVVNQV